MTAVSEDLIEGLQALRDAVGPLAVLSGFRCVEHNRAVGGRADSMHLLGVAADVSHDRLTRYELARAAERIAVFRDGGIGRYRGWIHVDARGHKARWDG